ncbi:MAG: DUF5915 domain-containing protein [Planctomycetaceae bacterium]|nr:DUF5915 domain-containing protein [Planctomycetaceae bacterium]
MTTAEYTQQDCETSSHTTHRTGLTPLASVHLAAYPKANEALINHKMLSEIQLMRELVSLGRAARSTGQLKVRQPLAGMKVMFSNPEVAGIFWGSDVIDNVRVIQDELNIKEMKVLEDKAEFEEYVSFTLLPDFKKLGPKLGKQLPKVKEYLAQADGAAMLTELDKNQKVVLKLSDGEVELTNEEIQIRLTAKEGWKAAQGPSCVVVLSTELTEELLAEGRAREVVRLIQDRRKELNLNYTDRILVGIQTPSQLIGQALHKHIEYIKGETLALDLKKGRVANSEPFEHTVDGEELTLYVASAETAAKAATETEIATEPEPAEELPSESRAREIIRLIQNRRKELALNATDRILVGIQTPSRIIGQTLYEHIEYIKKETLALDLKKGRTANSEPFEHTVDGEELTLSIAAAE